MNTILGELGKSKKFVELIKNIEEKQSPIGISGLSNVGMLETIASINEYSKKPIAIITYNEIQAKWIMENIQFFTDKAIYFPKKDIVTYNYVAESKDLPYSRIEALNKINNKRNYILVTTIEAAMQKLPAKQLLYKNTLKFKVGEIHSLEKIKQDLVNLGYTRCDLIEGRGQFSLRGGILDISINDAIGVRVEFWGDEIDSIRNFNIISQRSINTLEKVEIEPAHEYILEKPIEEICKKVCTFESENYSSRDRKIDRILTSKKFGIPIMILFLGIIFWITIVGANYPSEILFNIFNWIQDKLIALAKYIHCPTWISNLLINGIYQTLTWIIAVMLPPMAIFFPLFTILEDLGYLPRIAFNMDGFFKKACCSGKQMITMCMGFGCNACGVTGCRIIDSPRERLIAIITNNFVPCNGRFPFLITIATIFIAGAFAGSNKILASVLSTLAVVVVIIFGIFLTLIISKILSKTILKGMPSSMVLELPPYRKPQFGKILVRSIFDRTLFVLGRAISVAAPAGLVIWLLANIGINGESLLSIIANFLNPFAKLMGLDGYILTAFILGIPANEIVLPIILMCYLKGGALVNIEDTVQIGQILIQNGWTMLTAINVMLFTILHFPCATTLLTIKKETGSWKWTLLSFVIPTICGIILCMATNLVYNVLVVL